MGIIILDCACRKDKRTGWVLILSLVACEHQTHTGERGRIILKKNALKGCGVKFCYVCSKKDKKISEATRKLLRENGLGENNHFFGKKHTQETKEKIAISRIGKLRSKDSCLKQGLSMSGPNHYRWRDDLTLEDREQRDRHYDPRNYTWRKAVYERDNYTCQITGQKGDGDLVAHHLYGWTYFPKLRYNVDNGITLTEPVHKLFHSLYGTKNNTKLQFDEFKSGLEYNPFLYIYYKVFVEN